MVGRGGEKVRASSKRNALTRRVVQLQLMKIAVAQSRVVRLKAGGAQFMHVPGQLRSHETEHARRPAALMQIPGRFGRR